MLLEDFYYGGNMEKLTVHPAAIAGDTFLVIMLHARLSFLEVA